MEDRMLPVQIRDQGYHRKPMQTRRRMALGLLGLLVLTAAGTACGLPQLADMQPSKLAQTSFLYAADGSLITELHAT
jgi:hypothetical protein